jgi:hypothetical protein
VHVTRHTWRFAQRDYKLTATPPLSQLDTRLINILTLGHRGLYDDLMVIWTLQSLADFRLSKVPPEEVQRAVLAITRHGPQLESIYLLSCYIVAFDFKKPSFCEKILADGMAALPDSWRIPMLQGFIYHDLLKDMAHAALFYDLAASKKDAPAYFQRLAIKLAKKSDLSPEDLEHLSKELLPGGAIHGRWKDLLESRGTPPSP